jgi:hypothetical protein
MNMVEMFFGIIARQAICRGTFTSVPDLIGGELRRIGHDLFGDAAGLRRGRCDMFGSARWRTVVAGDGGRGLYRKISDKLSNSLRTLHGH